MALASLSARLSFARTLQHTTMPRTLPHVPDGGMGSTHTHPAPAPARWIALSRPVVGGGWDVRPMLQFSEPDTNDANAPRTRGLLFESRHGVASSPRTAVRHYGAGSRSGCSHLGHTGSQVFTRAHGRGRRHAKVRTVTWMYSDSSGPMVVCGLRYARSDCGRRRVVERLMPSAAASAPVEQTQTGQAVKQSDYKPRG